MDGHDLRKYTLASLRNQVALVSQNIPLWALTIRLLTTLLAPG